MLPQLPLQAELPTRGPSNQALVTVVEVETVVGDVLTWPSLIIVQACESAEAARMSLMLLVQGRQK
jgi:hypothetical protein